MIRNPIITGFNPDASIVRVGDDYYIATSTFEWFPGVAIYHSRDLVHWRLLAYPLNDTRLLDLKGIPSSGGVWAPCLSYDNGVFYLCYTVMRSRKGVYKDMRNYVTTATSILGPWSDPVYLNGTGFDPSLFHDTDGRKWLLNMHWDHRQGQARFGGVYMQEYDAAERKLTGPVRRLTKGTAIGVTEGPHLYKIGDYYYLLVAEGGTGRNHAATMMRSKTIEGPYEVDPAYPIVTSAGDGEHPLQNAGHGCLVETQSGEWYMTIICARMLPDGRQLNPLGRETALQRIEWTADGWPRLAGGGRQAQLTLPAPALEPHPFAEEPATDHFDGGELGLHWQTLRVPANAAWLSLTERPGYLRLTGRESLYSWHEQSMVARRIKHFRCEAETCVAFAPESYYEMAGLVFYYDESEYFYLRVSHNEELGVYAGIEISERAQLREADEKVRVNGWEQVYLRGIVDYAKLTLYISQDGQGWQRIGPELDFGMLSDEYGGKLGFTGSMVGLCVQDLSEARRYADFDYFTYKERE
ncbi:xylan 1,4-beta-xylosidase [Paenibacillus sp. UNCCL117]|uniref:glycoside hydrolase family 43 protein n=1 Tax=unclassified Paenibacillus TaxID=185978 RepID=UPI00088008CB|nr:MULTISPECIES: glycoside hydrolase family 43 protein [unclassified Paenibacillus]SDD06884.1 xylan 1,4-beta-xylosidase [Paenibacillus sp. cl123]SFW31602.1 xylan 1,4-beta-xylosidase [Paenibacillus sp. UNCCL117]